MNQRLPAKLIRPIVILAVAWLLALSPGAGMNVHAQGAAEIKLTVRAGFDGICRQLHIYPVRVQVENNGKDLGDVRILVRYKYGNGEATHATDLALPAASRKETTLYARAVNSYRQSITVSLMDGNKTLASSNVNLNCVGEDTLVIGVIADDPAAYSQTGDSTFSNNPLRRAEPRLDELPEQVEGWETLDALIVAGVDTGALRREQRAALGEWVARGGRLFVVGGAKWQAVGAGLGELLPVQANGTQTVAGLPALAEYLRSDDALTGRHIVSVGSLREDAIVLIEQDGIPLLAEKPLGVGNVLYLAGDPALQPLNQWNRMDELYLLLLSPRPILPRWARPAAWDTYEAEQALSVLTELQAPSMLYMLCWLGGYIVLVGPFNYLLLKRLKRNHLAWISIPALAVLFTVIAYAAGGIYRGSGPVLNRLTVIQAWEDGEQARVQALVGLYSPNRAGYTLRMENLRASPIEDISASNNDWLDIQNGTTSQVNNIRVEAGGMKSFLVEGSMPALSITHTLTLKIGDKNPTLTGQITNNSPYTIRNAEIVLQGTRRTLGDLLPGKSASVNLALVNGSKGALVDLDAASILGIDKYPEKSKAARRLHFLNSILAAGYYNETPHDPNWGIHLMGWLDEMPLAVELDGRQAETIDTTLYVVSLAPTVQYSSKGPWRLTPAAFAWEGSDATVSPYGDMDLSISGYILHFKPAIPLRYRSVESLRLRLFTANTVDTPKFSLWDFTKGQWQTIDGISQGDSPIPYPERYVGPNGEVVIHVEANNTSYEEVVSSYFSLVVNP